MGDYLKKLFIDEAKPALERHSGGGGGENTLKKLLDYTKSCYYMFNYNKTITDLTDYFDYNDTENVTDMGYMFQNCSNLTTVSPLDTSNVTNMKYMFYACSKLTTVPPLDTSKVTDMNSMFQSCLSLTEIPRLDTSKVTDMNGMCRSCSKLTSIDISYYKTTSSTPNYSGYWCNACYSLKRIIIRDFGTQYTLNSTSFTNCHHLTGTYHATYNVNSDKDGYIYVPASMVDILKNATNWSTYADQIRALEDYTVDGTTTGELDESKI